MRRTWKVLALSLLLTGPLGLSAEAQEPAGATAQPVAGPAEQLARIHVTLEKIAVLLEAQVTDRRLELIARRLELEYQRIEPLERKLANNSAERDGLEQEKAELVDRIRLVRQQVDEGTLEIDAEQMELSMNELALRIRAIDRRVGDLSLSISEVENELGGARRDLRDWREILDRALSQP